MLCYLMLRQVTLCEVMLLWSKQCSSLILHSGKWKDLYGVWLVFEVGRFYAHARDIHIYTCTSCGLTSSCITSHDITSHDITILQCESCAVTWGHRGRDGGGQAVWLSVATMCSQWPWWGWRTIVTTPCNAMMDYSVLCYATLRFDLR